MLFFFVMDYDLFLDELRAANVSGREFARLMKLNPNSISNCKISGEVPSHLAVIAGLIRTLHENGIDHLPVFERIPIEKKKPRGRPDMQSAGDDTKG